MIRSELVARLAHLNPHLSFREADAVVDTILSRITDALVAGDRVELRGFWTFTVKHHEPRLRRNPKTGARFDAPAKRGVHFKPGKAMKVRLNLPAGSRSLKAE